MRSILSAIFGLLGLATGHAEPSTNHVVTPAEMATQIDQLLSDASKHAAEGNLEQAVRDSSVAIHLDPHNSSAYEVRGSIYIQEKLWDRADRDYTSADRLSPQVTYKYKLGEIKFLQKSYEDARPRFAKISGDPRLGDLATYKIFLCDLLGFHEKTAQQDLAAIDQAPRTPAYYFCHATWSLFHQQRPEGTKLLAEAQQAYPSSTIDPYIAILLGTQSFLPDVVTFTARDGRAFNQAHVYLETDGLHVALERNWITLPIDQLPDDLSVFPKDLRDRIAKVRAGLATPFVEHHPRVATSTQPTSPAPGALQDVTFTTRDGKNYKQVRAALADDGIQVITSAGWSTVAFSELPIDLSAFPPEWRAKIEARSATPIETRTSITKIVSFKTRKGKTYEQVRAAIEAKGLRLLTWEGWVAVPFDQLPDDLTPFPENWRKDIAMGRSKAHAARASP